MRKWFQTLVSDHLSFNLLGKSINPNYLHYFWPTCYECTVIGDININDAVQVFIILGLVYKTQPP